MPSISRQRSRGQMARRNSITRGSEELRDQRQGGKRRTNAKSTSRKSERLSSSSLQSVNREERPWLGGLYFTDLVFIAFTYSLNLLRTLGLAELADLVFKGMVYFVTRLPYDLYCRWTLSSSSRSPDLKRRSRKPRNRQRHSNSYKAESSSESETQDGHHIPHAFTSSHEEEPEANLAHSPSQLSPFHHLIILLVRFACSNFPHLVPRVLFAEETIGPFVYWRTGGGSNTMVQEFSDLQERQTPTLNEREGASKPFTTKSIDTESSFRAFLFSKDARLPVEVQRSNMASRSATTLLYLHGGGFSLGSVAFYAEALLRLRAKISALEAEDINEDNFADARCVAVEYDLSPAAKFPVPLLQCLRCYAHLIEVENVDPASICVAGDSAGGNLAMGLLLCLDGQVKGEELFAERDWSELPMPGKALLISPWVDLRPSHARAFSMLRGAHDTAGQGEEQRKVKKSAAAKGETKREAKEWAEAVADYDWDYVASEALLHFAEVYTGVLPSPRRVRGPLGWIAHICGVVAQEYGEDENVASSKSGYSDPMGALSALIRPSKRLAQATHDMLSDPILSKLFGLRDVNHSPSRSGKGHASSSLDVSTTTNNFEPLFTASDRKTTLVANLSDLYEPIGKQKSRSSSSTAEKMGLDTKAEDHARQKAERLLDTHPLISPAIGDWSRIKYKTNCLVTWGERERMAEDIEAWVDSACRGVDNEKDALPAQDGANEGGYEVPIVGKEGGEENDGRDCIETIVERGPGGVHAWPFVSMYLAGTEAERERGLSMLAEFIARSPPESASGTYLGDKRAEGKEESYFLDFPHAAPDSPISEGGSVGSMPSDVDLHGLIGDDDDDESDEEEESHSQSPPIDMQEAIRRAHEHQSSGSSHGSHHGLGLSNDEMDAFHLSSPRATPTFYNESLKGSSPAKLPSNVPTGQSQKPVLAAITTERERGRSRSPRRSVTVSSNTPSGPYLSSVRAPLFDMIQPQGEGSATASGRGRSFDMPADHGKWTQGDDEHTQRALVETSDSVPRRTMQGLDDIMDVSSDEAFSPNRSTSPPSQAEMNEGDDMSEEEQEITTTLASIPLDISHFGLSHYAIRRPEPEGLSDIAEEGSVMSASMTSAGEFSSRSLSPEERIPNQSPQLSLAAASMMMEEQAWTNRRDRSRWPVEDDDEASGEEEEEESEDLGRPGPSLSLPLVHHQSGLKSTEDVTYKEGDTSHDSQGEANPANSSPTSVKTTKAEVWW
ncbi:hypothetical protein CBS101457_004369 [Exobasidium rhododendri]|nr:hypothetical protein CBS101457_004369 [Exobasidium rhododendri]